MALGFYSCWQPLTDEDRHTALVFGFLRHAPAAIGLELWLTRVLGRPVQAAPLTPRSFWPLLPSRVDGASATEPELVFEAVDEAGPLTVVVEVKPGIGMQRLDQLARETIDVATHFESSRVALIAVDPDLGSAVARADWQSALAEQIASQGMRVEGQIYACSFALLGEVVAAVGRADPTWKPYADDVLAQLSRKGLLRYQGAPMLDDLQPLTPATAVEAFNRVIATARGFYLELHQDAAFAAGGFTPSTAGSDDAKPRMLRNGRTDKLHQPQAVFATTVILATYDHPSLSLDTHLFVAFDLQPGQGGQAAILAGRWDHDRPLAPSPTTFATALNHEHPSSTHPGLPLSARAGISRWTYDRHPWDPANPGGDFHWTIDRLTDALESVFQPEPARQLS